MRKLTFARQLHFQIFNVIIFAFQTQQEENIHLFIKMIAIVFPF